MKVKRIWNLEAGEVLYSIIVQTHRNILFSLLFLFNECLVLMPVSTLCQWVAYVWYSEGWLLDGQESSDMKSQCI